MWFAPYLSSHGDQVREPFFGKHAQIHQKCKVQSHHHRDYWQWSQEHIRSLHFRRNPRRLDFQVVRKQIKFCVHSPPSAQGLQKFTLKQSLLAIRIEFPEDRLRSNGQCSLSEQTVDDSRVVPQHNIPKPSPKWRHCGLVPDKLDWSLHSVLIFTAKSLKMLLNHLLIIFASNFLICSKTTWIFSLTLYFSRAASLTNSVSTALAWTNLQAYSWKLTLVSSMVRN